jgi:hypothetical protein
LEISIGSEKKDWAWFEAEVRQFEGGHTPIRGAAQ